MIANPETIPIPRADEESIFPAWMRQRWAVASGEKTWDDYTFEERTYKGWLFPYLLEIESMLWGRWNYWAQTIEEGKLLDEPIPYIEFISHHEPCLEETAKKRAIIPKTSQYDVMKMLNKCLDHHSCYSESIRLPEFLEWILWGLGGLEERPRVASNEKVNEHWYRTFNLGLMLMFPYDYLGDMLSEHKAGRTKWNNPAAFFPTPHPIAELMANVTMNDIMQVAKEKGKGASVYDCCVGTGRMLMHASNYSVNLYGQDIDRNCVIACKINAYLYMPWLIKPAQWLSKSGGIENKDSLWNPPTEETSQSDGYKINKPEQMTLF